MQNQDFEDIVKQFARLPGIGTRSARRIVLHLLTHKDTSLRPLSNALEAAAEKIRPCQDCHSLDTTSPCHICASSMRDQDILCVVENVADLWALERTGSFKGLYHVLGGTLSALDGVTPADLNIPHLLQRLENLNTVELIIALNATVEGQTTAHYIAGQLQGRDIKITRLARGVPMGSALDYLDDNTLVTALNSRSAV